MITLPEQVILPLQIYKHGDIRVSGTRVTLHTIVTNYRNGNSPENIYEGFPTVPLADIYAVISYYLANQEAVDAYMREVDEEGERIRQQWEALYTPEQKARTEHFRKLLKTK